MAAGQQASLSAGEPKITITPRTVSANATSPASATAGINFNADGTITNGIGSFLENWITPQALEGNYQLLVTVTSGTLSSGTSGSQLNLGTNRSYTRVQSGVGSSSVTFTAAISQVSSGIVKASASITLTATVSA